MCSEVIFFKKSPASLLFCFAKNEDIVRYPYFLFLVLMQIKQTTRLTAEGCSTALSPSASSGRKNEDEKSKRSNDSRARNAK